MAARKPKPEPWRRLEEARVQADAFLAAESQLRLAGKTVRRRRSSKQRENLQPKSQKRLSVDLLRVMFAEIFSSVIPGCPKPSTNAQAIARKDQLRTSAMERYLGSLGMGKAVVNRVFLLLVVYSQGVNEIMRDLRLVCTGPAAETIAARFWKFFAFLLEQCHPCGESDDLLLGDMRGDGSALMLGRLEAAHFEACKTFVAERMAELDMLQGEEKHKQRAVALLGSRIRNMHAQINKTQADKANVQQAISNEVAAMDSAREELRRIKTTTLQWERKRRAVQEKLAMASHEQRQLKSYCAHGGEQLRAGHVQHRELLVTVREETRRVSRQEESLMIMQNSIDSLARKQALCEKRVAARRKRVSELGAEEDTLTLHIANLKERIAVLHEEREAFDRVVDGTQSHIYELRRVLNLAQEAGAHVKRAREQQERELQAAMRECKMQVHDLDLVVTELRQMRQVLRQYDRSVMQHTASVAQSRMLLQTQEQRTDQLSDRLAELRTQAEAHTSDIEAVRQDIWHDQMQAQALGRQHDSLTAELSSRQAQRRLELRCKHGLEEELRGLEAQWLAKQRARRSKLRAYAQDEARFRREEAATRAATGRVVAEVESLENGEQASIEQLKEVRSRSTRLSELYEKALETQLTLASRWQAQQSELHLVDAQVVVAAAEVERQEEEKAQVIATEDAKLAAVRQECENARTTTARLEENLKNSITDLQATRRRRWALQFRKNCTLRRLKRLQSALTATMKEKAEKLQAWLEGERKKITLMRRKSMLKQRDIDKVQQKVDELVDLRVNWAERKEKLVERRDRLARRCGFSQEQVEELQRQCSTTQRVLREQRKLRAEATARHDQLSETHHQLRTELAYLLDAAEAMRRTVQPRRKQHAHTQTRRWMHDVSVQTPMSLIVSGPVTLKDSERDAELEKQQMERQKRKAARHRKQSSQFERQRRLNNERQRLLSSMQ